MSATLPKVLYIAGYGRSGSTVLDILLGGHSEIASVGELTYLLDDWSDPQRNCACGQPYANCTFWSGFFDELEAGSCMRRTVRGVERRSRTFHTLFGFTDSRERKAYSAYHQALFSYIQRSTGKNIVVDSSKSARDAALRFYALSQIAELDVYVLHLVRSGSSTVKSVARRGSNWALEGHRAEPWFLEARTILGWALANAWATGVSKQYVQPSRYLRVRFEDLTSRPAVVLKRIGDFAGIEVSTLIDRIERGEAFEVGHNVGGNRLRHQGKVRLRVRGDANSVG